MPEFFTQNCLTVIPPKSRDYALATTNGMMHSILKHTEGKSDPMCKFISCPKEANPAVRPIP
jgi:hypothetical protein